MMAFRDIAGRDSSFHRLHRHEFEAEEIVDDNWQEHQAMSQVGIIALNDRSLATRYEWRKRSRDATTPE